MPDKKLTIEEIAKEREKTIKSLEANLQNEFYLNILGVNDLTNPHGPYGAFGLSIGEGQYSGVFENPEAGKIRKEIYDKEMEARNKMGISDRPAYPDNYQVTKYVMGIMQQSIGLGNFAGLPLGNLEKILGKMNKSIKMDIPEQLEQYEEAKNRKIEEHILEEKKLTSESLGLDNDSEKAIAGYKSAIYATIRRAAVLKLMNKHGYDDFNAATEKIGEDYRKAKGIEEPEKKVA